MTSVPVLNYDAFFAAAKARFKEVREATFTEVVARLRANYSCRQSWLKMSSEASFERVYLFYFFRTYGTDGDIFVELKPALESAGRALNHHLRALVATWPSMDADDLAMSARKFIKIQFGQIFVDLIDLTDNIKSDDTEILRNADSCTFGAGQQQFEPQCAATSAEEIREDVLPLYNAECSGGP